MNKKYNENRIQELLKVASDNITPSDVAFDVLLSKLDTKTVKPNIYTKPVLSPFSVFKLAGAFTAFVLVVLGVRNISTPLQNTITPGEGAGGAVLTQGSEIALGTIGSGSASENSAGSGSATGESAARSMSSTFAKSSAQSPEAREIESATLNSLVAESQADSELLALSPDI